MEGYERLVQAIAEGLRRVEKRLAEEGKRQTAFIDFPHSLNTTALYLWPEDYDRVQAHVYPILKGNEAIDRYREKNGWFLSDDEYAHSTYWWTDCYQCGFDTTEAERSARSIIEFLVMHGVASVDGACIRYSKPGEDEYGAPVSI